MKKILSAMDLKSSLALLAPLSLGIGITMVSCKSSTSSVKDVIPFKNGDALISLGDSYNSLSQRINPSANCVTGTVTQYDPGASDTNVESSESGSSLMREYSGEVDGTPRISFVNFNSQGGFYRSLESSEKSLSVVFSTRIEKGTERFTKPSLDEDFKGKSSADLFDDCGDSFVSQINKGGRLTITAKFDFSSKEQRNKWQAISKLNSPWGKISSDIKEKASNTDATGYLSINIKQEGGSPEAAPMAAKTCSISSPKDLNACLEAIQKALDYASNDFPTQVAQAPAVLSYRTQKLSDLVGVSSFGYRVSEEILKIRSDLKAMLDHEGETLARYKMISELGFELPMGMASAINGNIDKIKQVAASCYDHDSVDQEAGPLWWYCEKNFAELDLDTKNNGLTILNSLVVRASDRKGQSIVNTYMKPINVQVQVNSDDQWQIAEGNSDYLGYGACTDNCPSNGAPIGALLALETNQKTPVRQVISNYTINPGESLSFMANAPLNGYSSHEGELGLHWICANCDGETLDLNADIGIYTELAVAATSSRGITFRNKNSDAQTFRVTSSGFWTNGPSMFGGTSWSGPEGQRGSCGEGCPAPSLPLGALILMKDDGQYQWVNGTTNFTLESQQNSTFVFNDVEGGYQNNVGNLDLLVKCTSCE